MESIGSRIKQYEAASNFVLTPRSCLFIRIDGKAFHSYTKDMNKPFDQKLINAMVYAAYRTKKEMAGFKGAYLQSDECTFMLTDFDNLQTQGWFNYKLNKIVSISASMFTAYFNEMRPINKTALFDSRAFIVPKDDAPNVFVWRQQDWERNSLQMLARQYYSQNELNKKSKTDIHEMLYKKGINWSDLENVYKNGTFIFNGEKEPIHEKLNYFQIVDKLGLLNGGNKV